MEIFPQVLKKVNEMKTIFVLLIPMFFLAMNQRPLNKQTHASSRMPVLKKAAPLLGTRWNLVELSGKRIPVNATAKNRFIILKSGSTVSGNGGCNAFSGNYSLGKDNEISFGEMVRTNVLCPGIDVERNFLDALAKADHYDLKGDTLILKNQLINLAGFVAEK